MDMPRSFIWSLTLLLACTGGAHAQSWPDHLPHYDIAIALDVPKHTVQVRQRVTWTNPGPRPTSELVFNAHSHYSIPDKDVGLLAKMTEILRMAPSEAMSFDGPPLALAKAAVVEASRGRQPAGNVEQTGGAATRLTPAARQDGPEELPPPVPVEPTPVETKFPEDNPTSLVMKLPREVAPGESVTVVLDFALKLPARKGRWGQWEEITTLAQWLPVLAVYGPKGWEPVPFIPWHQPYYNEAGIYTVNLKVTAGQKVAASAPVKHQGPASAGWELIEYETVAVRDFALVASARFEEIWTEADGVKVRCLATPEHQFYAKVVADAAADAIPVYNRWFGRLPYKQFTIVEACFGWNGNECGGLVMLDDRMMNMPHMAKNYMVALIQHELCHQWWYNVVGTNGYGETWMDEGLATYFSHRLADLKLGKNNPLITYPKGFEWAPNIRRDDFRNYGMTGAWARGERHPAVQEMPKYEHLVNLMAATYDRGSKVVGLIEERLGPDAFLDFMRHIYAKYRFRILRVADFQRELEEATHSSWEEFFQYWVYGTGRCDWGVDHVELDGKPAWRNVFQQKNERHHDGVRVVVHLTQHGGFNEPTVLGIRTEAGDGFQMRIPIDPSVPILQLDDCDAKVECTTRPHPQNKGEQQAIVRVELTLAEAPKQLTVDPDHVLIDSRPTNNEWKTCPRFHITPFYTFLDDTDVTNAYDRLNINIGPWLYFSSYSNPWYTISPLFGLRAGVYRTQDFYGGVFLAYRSNDRNIVVGGDALWDHVLLPQMQLGLYAEQKIATLGPNDIPTSRAAAYARYVLMYGDSLYLPPFEYVETFGVVQNRGLPNPTISPPGTNLFNDRAALGVHYHKYLLTPYWDPEGGAALDVSYQHSVPVFGNTPDFQLAYGQFSFVKHTPKLFDWDSPVSNWLHETRWAFRAGGAAGLPNNGQFFALGGGDQFRGYDLAQRQGSLVWLSSVEWRLPIAQRLHWDFCDHIAGVRNIYAVPFYDVGNAYVNGRQLGTIAHAVGGGLRMDVSWLGLIERTMVRFDVAKTVNDSTPWQFWFGIMHPF